SGTNPAHSSTRRGPAGGSVDASRIRGAPAARAGTVEQGDCPTAERQRAHCQVSRQRDPWQIGSSEPHRGGGPCSSARVDPHLRLSFWRGRYCPFGGCARSVLAINNLEAMKSKRGLSKMASKNDLSELLAAAVQKTAPSVLRVEARSRTPSTG